MARNLLAAGHEVVACDLDPTRAAALGGPVAANAREAVAGADVAITSLPSPAAVEQVAREIRGAGIALFVDMSTGPPALARRLAADLAAEGTESLDAPVSGGPRGAEQGTLTVMVGGAEQAFAQTEELLRGVGARLVVHVGGPGAGQAAKLCNNLIAGVTVAAIAEACAIAEREGIDPALLYGVLTASTGDSRVLRARFPIPGVDPAHPASAGYEALFALDLIAKDLALVRELALEHGVSPTQAEAALSAYRVAQEAGLGDLDYSAIYLAER